MSFNFVIPEMNIGGTGVPTLQFYKRGFVLNGTSEVGPSWQDIILSGVGALTLSNSIADGLNYLKLFGGTEQRNLPVGYTQVDGVTNTSVSSIAGYIDTGIVADVDDMEYDVVAKVNNNDAVSWYLLQSRASSQATIYGISGSQNGNTIICGFCGTSVQSPSITRQQDHTYHVNFKCKNGNATLFVEDLTAGTSETATGTYTFAAATTNTGLFSNINGGVQTIFVGNTSVLSAYIKKSGVKVMDYVSCKDSNSTAGFYDKVTSTFKGATAGGMQAGSNTVPSPSTPMDIWCNNGVLKLSPNVIKGDWNLNKSRTSAAGALYNLDGAVASELFPVLPNTEYICCYNGVAQNSRWYEYDSSQTFITNSFVSNSLKITTSATTRYISVSVLSTQSFQVITDEKYKLVSVNVGDTALPYHPYGTTYTDGTTETVGVTGANLINITPYIQEKTYPNGSTLSIKADGTIKVHKVAGDSIQIKIDEVLCQSGVEYTLKAFGNCSTTIAYPSIDGTYLSGTDTYKTFTGTGSRDNIIVYSASAREGDVEYKLILVKGETEPTTYEPYYSDGTATATDLYAVGTYKDIQSVLDGSVTRNIGIKVLDGTENWRATSNAGKFYLNPAPQYLKVNDISGLCTHYPVMTSQQGSGGITNGYFGFYTGSSTQTIHEWYIADSSFADVTALTTYLATQYNAGQPVIVIYPLATATTESVTGQTLTTQAGTNIVEITQASMDNLGLEVSYKAQASGG